MLAEVVIAPFDKGKSLSAYVAKVVNYIRKEADKKDMKYQLTSMGTLIEGKDDDVWDILRGAHETMKQYSNRVYTIIHIDDKKGRIDAIDYKKSKVEDLLKDE